MIKLKRRQVEIQKKLTQTINCLCYETTNSILHVYCLACFMIVKNNNYFGSYDVLVENRLGRKAQIQFALNLTTSLELVNYIKIRRVISLLYLYEYIHEQLLKIISQIALHFQDHPVNKTIHPKNSLFETNKINRYCRHIILIKYIYVSISKCREV